MQNYKVGKKVHVLEDTAFEHLLPASAVRITQTEADVLNIPIPETPAEANTRKDEQVEFELGIPMVRLLLDTLVPMINGAVNPATVLIQLKAKRKAEL